ncbi:hypothetical protein ACFX2A_031706 [Malus domestica]
MKLMLQATDGLPLNFGFTGNDVNASDADGYTPLMLAAREGLATLCELLISLGEKCDIANAGHETTLLLARKSGIKNDAENLILEELAKR